MDESWETLKAVQRAAWTVDAKAVLLASLTAERSDCLMAEQMAQCLVERSAPWTAAQTGQNLAGKKVALKAG